MEWQIHVWYCRWCSRHTLQSIHVNIQLLLLKEKRHGLYIFMFGIDLCSKLVSYSLFSKARKISNKSRIWINMQAIMWNMTRSLGTVNELLAEFPLLNCPGNRFLIVLEYPAALSLSQWKYANYYNILVS